MEPSQKSGWEGEVVGLDSTQLWGPCDDPPACSARSGASGAANFQGSAGPGWGPSAGPWARGAPTSGRQQREAAEQQQRQRDEARRRGALHGAGGLGRRTKARRAAATRSSRAWAANASLLRAAFNYPARRRRGGGGARGDPPSLPHRAAGARRHQDSPARMLAESKAVRCATHLQAEGHMKSV